MNREHVYTSDAESLELINALRGYLPLLMQKHHTPGLNIALADNGSLVWEAGFGYANLVRRTPMSPDSVYHSGSLGKIYTGVAVMILVDRGVIRLQDPINQYLPFQVVNPLGQRDVTIHDLLTHTSGLGSDDAASSWSPGISLAEDLAKEYSRDWSPTYGGRFVRRWIKPVGVEWNYSNLGVATLGLIVERTNSEVASFGEFVQRYVMDPLKMTHSCYPVAQHEKNVPSEIWKRRASGYSRMGGVSIPTLPLFFREYPAGGVLGRPADHIRLLLAMINLGELDGYRLLSPDATRRMVEPATTFGSLVSSFAGPIGEQGLIWRIRDRGFPWESFGHGGGHMFGWRTDCRAWPNYRSAVTIGVTQWNLPDDTRDVEEVLAFIGTWLRYRQPRGSHVPSKELSYMRGALLAAAYRVAIGIGEDVPEGSLEAAIGDVQDLDGSWDANAFRRGFEAMAAVPASLGAVRSFWSSNDCEIDISTVFRAYAALGGKTCGGLLWNLLPIEDSIAKASGQQREGSA